MNELEPYTLEGFREAQMTMDFNDFYDYKKRFKTWRDSQRKQDKKEVNHVYMLKMNRKHRNQYLVYKKIYIGKKKYIVYTYDRFGVEKFGKLIL